MSYTFDYPYCEFPFDEWNPVQELCLPHFERDCNLVLAASVAAGKTAVAEAIMGYEISRADDSKAVYVSPLKAIGSEKTGEWASHPTFGEFPQALLDGEHHPAPAELGAARLVAATAEALAMALRRGDSWLAKAAVLVLDEAHLLGDPQRGPAAEAMLMEFAALNPAARLILLSGTLPNVRELAGWLKRLNGKPTAFIASPWRPTPLAKTVETADTIRGEADIVAGKAAGGGKTLCFVHSKTAGRLLVKELKRRGIRAEFYSAALPQPRREWLADSFRRAGKREPAVLVATSALAMGVTL